ncbi:YdeI/OmpD-associated family protein [Parapedobacter sp. 10938]|uniref:YdeI/OmpD-associated family protein n=1 Tax=Parapedobacter flavus TaxID=3110225 RepID=UPI002DB76947|nr:YdeI/OmpD-associated family protein [Parapedobacter sp. 10938]MEC3881755.1 YdeI/OmpD-associated family protein [Parapedobacter sp. 10938]
MDYETIYAASNTEWRQWLLENHGTHQGIWLIQYKKHTGKPTISWTDAVDEALCFGWIDSIKKKLDDDRSIQFFSKRKPTGTWSKINKEKVERLIADGLMEQAGLDCVETAKRNGSWTILDTVEALLIPDDLAAALDDHNGSKTYFDSLSKTSRKALLQWVVLAKRPETRQKRIAEIAAAAAQGKKPNGF